MLPSFGDILSIIRDSRKVTIRYLPHMLYVFDESTIH